MDLDYAQAEPGVGWRPSRRLIVAAAAAAFSLAVSLYVALAALSAWNPYFGEQRNRCTSTLRSLGGALARFEQQHDRYPDTLSELIADQNLGPRDLYCWTQNYDGSSAMGVEEFAAAVDQGRLTSYHYVGRGMNRDTAGDAVVAYDRSGAHGDEGINVLYKNGEVKWLPTKRARRVLGDLEAGRNPPRSR